MSKKIKVLSLFSGCGGMDLGFEGGFKCLRRSINETIHPDWIKLNNDEWVELVETGFETVFANDIRPDAKTVWVNYFNDRYNDACDRYHLESIVDLVKKENNGIRVFPRNVDIVTGGFPCQDFSVAGKRKGFNSDKSHNGKKISVDEPTIENRGQLYIWMKEVISIVKPKMFVAENVKGLTSLEDVKEIIEHDFANAADGGYLVLPAKVLQAANYGVPQSRERVIFFGFRKNALSENALKVLSSTSVKPEYDPYPVPTHSYSVVGNSLEHFVTCKEILYGLEEPNEAMDVSQTKYSKAKFIKKGQGNIEIKLDSVAPTIRSEHHGNIEFRRLSKENGGTHFEELEKGFQERRLTVRECARLQTFPNDYQFVLPKTESTNPVSASEAYKLIGNAVPCLLSFNIAMRLSQNWNLYFE